MEARDATKDAARSHAWTNADDIRQQINKRLTLNLLIQGAAAHNYLTGHFLVKDQLEALRPGLTRLYDRFATSGQLNYWLGDFALLRGLPSWFWARTGRPTHPFHHCPLLAKHGGQLSRKSKRFMCARSWKKWVIPIPIVAFFQLLYLLIRTALAERRLKPQLIEIAKTATSLIWGIDEDRLDGAIVFDCEFGNVRTPRTWLGRNMKDGASGYGGVERRKGQFHVVAKAWNFPLLLHELTKGTVELVCLHGLASLDDATYDAVTDDADQIEFELPMLQAGIDMWQRLLAALPRDRTTPEMLMHVAQLDPQPLERLMLDVVEDPEHARDVLAELGRDCDD